MAAARSFASTQAFMQCERLDAPACLVLDIRLPGRSGLELQRELTRSDIRLPIVFITGHGDVPMSVSAMKAGAIEFLVAHASSPDPERTAVVGASNGTTTALDFTVFAAMLAWAGEAHLAAHVVVVRIILVTFLPCHALGQASGVLVGQALGAGRPERCRDSVRLATIQAVGIMVVMGVVFVALPDALTGVFGAEAEVQALARQVLLLYAAVQVLDAVAVVGLGSLSGAGDTRFVLVVSVGLAWFVKVPLAYALAVGAELGVVGAWLGLAGELVVLALIVSVRVRGSRWLGQLSSAPAAVSLA